MKHPMTKATALLLASVLAVNTVWSEDKASEAASKTPAVENAQLNRDRARIANETAAAEAAKAVLESNRLDLDIRLIGPTSIRIAGDR